MSEEQKNISKKKKIVTAVVAVVVAIALLVTILVLCLPNDPNDPTPDNPTHTEHIWGEWETFKQATCTERGELRRTCTQCDAYETMPEKELGHILDPKTEQVKEPATCIAAGVMQGKCSRCGQTAERPIAALGHSMEWSIDENTHVQKCTRCKQQEGTPEQHVFNGENQCTECGYTKQTSKHYVLSEDGKTLTFGSYPQSEVTDNALISNLNAEIQNKLPSSDDLNSWTDYGYYIQGKVQSYMWYIDVEYKSDKYRGVYFTEYRPENAGYGTGNSNSKQDENGYTTGKVYWFKFDPITWRILTQENGKAFVAANFILDSREFDALGSNNYAASGIRKWLNDAFLKTALANLEDYVVVTNVDNSADSTGVADNGNICENTNDKVFLLSYAEVLNEDLGFDFDTRKHQSTDYAKIQGVNKNSSGYGYWLLRSPSSDTTFDVRAVHTTGMVSDERRMSETSCGIVPALYMVL